MAELAIGRSCEPGVIGPETDRGLETGGDKNHHKKNRNF